MKQENNSSEVDKLKIGRTTLYVYIGIMSIMLLMIFCGNILTIIAILKFKHLRTKTNALVCSLSFGDLFVGISLIPDVTYVMLEKYKKDDSIDMIIIFGIIQTGYLVSVAHIACIASERYIFVMYPLRYHSLMTVKVIKLLLCICWIVPFLLGLTYVAVIKCLGSEYFMYFEIVASILHVLVGLIASFVYTRILLVVAEQQKRIIAEQNAVTKDTGRSKINTASNQHKSTLALGMVVIAYVLLWSPVCITTILEYFSSLPGNETFEICSEIAYILSSSNSAINCIIYTWKSTLFRKAYISLLKCQDIVVNHS